MLLRTLKRQAIGIGTCLLVFGWQPLAAECVSATFADEVVYSCSGVLTVVPRVDQQDTAPIPETEASVSEPKASAPQKAPTTTPDEGPGTHSP